jgi:hypothetical protein
VLDWKTKKTITNPIAGNTKAIQGLSGNSEA